MALYIFEFTIPPNTPKNRPFEKIVKVGNGVVKKVEIRIPPGHYGFAGMRIYAQEIPILPENPEAWVYGNDEIVFDEPLWLILRPEYEFKLVGYNESPNFEHTFLVRFIVTPLTAYRQLPIPEEIKTLQELLTE